MNIQLFANGTVLRAVTKDQAKQLEDLIKEIRKMPDSLPLESRSMTQRYSGGGDNIRQTGTMNIYKGKGDAFYNVINGTANFGSRK